jgi:carbamoyl-phosphate synthase large subunit
MGVHTGDSIVVAPSQTLTNREYHLLRIVSFKVVRALGIVGECNIQFALNPNSEEFRVIEVNPRLSRSSALASKATGYPIAYIAAKLALGYTLPELINKVTGVTTACFEPALDYIVVKIPRWDFQKFKKIDRRVGTEMKSVGEVMAIGRSFEETLQKAVRMLDIGRELTDTDDLSDDLNKIKDEMENPTDLRLFYIVKALEKGVTVEEINKLTGIDKWFLWKIKNIIDVENSLKALDKESMQAMKRLGFSDKKIGKILGIDELKVRQIRRSFGISPVVKQIDTLAAEWAAKTNYLYLTYNGEEDDIEFTEKKKALVLGSGCYRIGASVEFDWCCVNMAWALKKYMEEVIMLNYNPETVSTDFDVLDKLYFDELTFERVMDIYEKENPVGLVLCVGGQIPNNLALKLARENVRILGTSAENIDRAENRAKFSLLLNQLGIPQPAWCKAESIQKAKEFAEEVGYPVLIRPSYVLSGAAMKVAFNENEMEEYLAIATKVSREYPVVVSKFIVGAKEVEVDGVCDGENVFIGAIIEHVEHAGVHSGDATMCIPALSLSEEIKRKLRTYSKSIARQLGIVGPFNIQFLVKDGEAYVIECNLRASRSMPFVSKTIGINLMEIAAKAIMGEEIPDGEKIVKKYGVKSPQFSFMRLSGADPVTGVEMVSTGEVACFGSSFEEAFAKSLIASGFRLPEPGDKVLLISSDSFMMDAARMLANKGFEIFVPEWAYKVFEDWGTEIKTIKEDLLEYLANKEIKLVINVPPEENSFEYSLRRKAAEFGVPVITNLELARKFLEVIL